jgi:hypothetical protein
MFTKGSTRIDCMPLAKNILEFFVSAKKMPSRLQALFRMQTTAILNWTTWGFRDTLTRRGVCIERFW